MSVFIGISRVFLSFSVSLCIDIFRVIVYCYLTTNKQPPTKPSKTPRVENNLRDFEKRIGGTDRKENNDMKITLNDMRTATALVRYASTNWKGCFTAEEIRQYSRDVLTDVEILRTYLVNLAEDIDTLRDRHQYATEEIELFNNGKEILKRMTV